MPTETGPELPKRPKVEPRTEIFSPKKEYFGPRGANKPPEYLATHLRMLHTDTVVPQEPKAEAIVELEKSREFIDPTGQILFQRLKSLLERTEPNDLITTLLEIDQSGEVTAFEHIGIGVGWKRINFQHALSELQKGVFELSFVIKPNHPQSADKMNGGFGYGSGLGPAQFVDFRYLVMRVTQHNEQKLPMVRTGYADTRTSRPLAEIFDEIDDGFTSSNDAESALINIHEFHDQENIHKGVLRDAMVVIDQDLPEWYIEQESIKADFISSTQELLMSSEETGYELFDFQKEGVRPMLESVLEQITKRKDLLRNTFKLPQDQKYAEIKLPQFSDLSDFLLESQKQALILLDPEVKSTHLDSDWIASLDIRGSYLDIEEPKKVPYTEPVDSFKTGKVYSLVGLTFSHPHFPGTEIYVEYNPTEFETSDDFNKLFTDHEYLINQRIISVSLRSQDFPTLPISS